MKYLLFIFCFLLLISCQHNTTIQKNYFVTKNGGYFEVYFRKDSMRIASENYWIQLSKWRKIAIKNDTLYFEAFGEWNNATKAFIKQEGDNTIVLHFLDSSSNLTLLPLKENIIFENEKGFWKGFQTRKKRNH